MGEGPVGLLPSYPFMLGMFTCLFVIMLSHSHMHLGNLGLYIYPHNRLSSDQWCLFRLNSLKLIKTSSFPKFGYLRVASRSQGRSGSTPSFPKWHIQWTRIHLSLIHICIFFWWGSSWNLFRPLNHNHTSYRIWDCIAERNHGLLCVCVCVFRYDPPE